MNGLNKKHVFLIASALLLVIDATFIAINYLSASSALQSTINRDSKNYRNTIQIAIDIISNNMLQITTYIAQDETLNQLFLKGKKAVESEGGGAGKKQAALARTELLNHVLPAWKEMQEQFNVRQLHYHLGPGSTSFLRVHKPAKFGDNMDAIRHTVVDTNQEHRNHTGFETGRVYSGLRGVVPITTMDPESGAEIHVGALETGTSFATVLDILRTQFQLNIAVFLTREHIEKNMWPDAITTKFGKQMLSCDCVQEATTSAQSRELLALITLDSDFDSDNSRIVKIGDSDYAVSYFPLRDYEGKKHPEQPDAGFFLVWEDITTQVDQFHSDMMVNIVFGILGFIIVELAIYFSLAAATRKLNTLVNERTEQLAVANAQKDKLFAILAHDLRNPLSPIKGFASYIADNYGKAPESRIVEAATTIRNISQNAVLLLENLLQWARYQVDGVELKMESVAVSDIVNMVMNLYQPIADEKGTVIQNSTGDTSVFADRFALETILRNLVSNAVKYTDHGLVEIGVDHHAGNKVLFVKDTGVGMDDETREQLARNVIQASRAGTAGEKGSGVGFSLANELARKMGYEIKVTSQVGFGSRFDLEFKSR